MSEHDGLVRHDYVEMFGICYGESRVMTREQFLVYTHLPYDIEGYYY